jgi:hypothetical protein
MGWETTLEAVRWGKSVRRRPVACALVRKSRRWGARRGGDPRSGSLDLAAARVERRLRQEETEQGQKTGVGRGVSSGGVLGFGGR